MPEKIIRPLKSVNNVQMADYIRSKSSPDYQNRVPRADKAGLDAVVRAVTEYRPNYNEFADGLINQIGSVIARNVAWQNPLSIFKQGMMSAGDTIEEIQTGLLTAHTYDPTRDSTERLIFGTELPQTEANFHQINRQDMYKVSVNRPMLQRAFTSENNGLDVLVNQLMTAPTTSDYWDEFLLMTSLFAIYEANGGFYHVNVPDVKSLESDVNDAKSVIRKMRAMAGTLKFLSTKYNAAGMPVFANPEDLILFVTPEFNAAIDVEALAAAFNIERTSMYGRVIEIPDEYFGISGCQAILTTSDFFVVADTLLENAGIFDPSTLTNNYFLHHHGIVSASRFAPAIMFWTGADDEVIDISTPVTSVAPLVVQNLEGAVVTSVSRGLTYEVLTEAITTPAGGPNDAVRFSLTGNTSLKTRITQTGTLFIGGAEGAASITVKATSTWLNPENLREDGRSATIALAIGGVAMPEWPETGEILGITVRGIDVPAFVPGTLAYNTTVDAPLTAEDIVVHTGDGGGDVDVTVNEAGTVATVKFDGGVGAGATYTITAV